MRVQHKKPNNKLAWIIATTLLVITLYFLFAYANSTWPFNFPRNGNQNGTQTEINYSPPTDEEIEHSQDGKKNSTNNEPQDDKSPAEQRDLSVEISFAGKINESQIDIRAFTPDVIEGTGTCTATLTKGGYTVTGTSVGFIDASSTICEPMVLDTNKFSSAGVWTLTVSYKSPTGSGTSKEIEVNI